MLNYIDNRISFEIPPSLNENNFSVTQNSIKYLKNELFSSQNPVHSSCSSLKDCF